MPPTLATILTGLAQGLRIDVLESPEPGTLDPVTVGLARLPETVQLGELLAGTIDLTGLLDPLTLVAKDVQFNDFLPETPTADRKSFVNLDQTGTAREILSGTPLVQQSVSGFTTVPGVPGLLAQLAGLVAALDGTVPVTATTDLPVTVDVAWTVATQQTGGTVLTAGTDYVALNGLNNLTASFVLPPAWREAIGTAAPVTSWWIRAVVTLSAGGASSPQTTVPPLEVRVPAASLTTLVRERLRVDVAATAVDPAEAVEATVVEARADSALTRLRERFPAVAVDVSYTIVDPSGATAAAADVSGATPTGSVTPGVPLRFFLEPVLETFTTTSPTVQRWRVRVSVRVANLPRTASPITVDLPEIGIHQRGLPVPLVLLAFDGTNYGPGDATGARQETYAFLSPGNPIGAGTVIDRGAGIGAQGAIKHALVSHLTAFRDVATAVRTLFPGAIPQLDVAAFESVVSALGNTAAERLVVDGTRDCKKLADREPGWNNRFSSLAVIGPPSSRALHLFPDERQGGTPIAFRVPANALIASYTSLETWTTDSVPAGQPTSGTASFGNAASSSRWA